MADRVVLIAPLPILVSLMEVKAQLSQAFVNVATVERQVAFALGAVPGYFRPNIFVG